MRSIQGAVIGCKDSPFAFPKLKASASTGAAGAFCYGASEGSFGLAHYLLAVARDVYFGSEADIVESADNVCFTPKSGHQLSALDVRFVPKADILRCDKNLAMGRQLQTRPFPRRSAMLHKSFAADDRGLIHFYSP
jgi:hypothetical protein